MIETVILSAQVQSDIFRHAMVTEKEEIMGFLLGQVDATGSKLVINGLDATMRSDRKSDRVEVSPEQAVASSQKAEQIGLRVLGWYHSHPHITVWPSHVDLRTQFSMQQMDRDFVGIICSVFSQLDLSNASLPKNPKKRRVLAEKGDQHQAMPVKLCKNISFRTLIFNPFIGSTSQDDVFSSCARCRRGLGETGHSHCGSIRSSESNGPDGCSMSVDLVRRTRSRADRLLGEDRSSGSDEFQRASMSLVHHECRPDEVR